MICVYMYIESKQDSFDQSLITLMGSTTCPRTAKSGRLAWNASYRASATNCSDRVMLPCASWEPMATRSTSVLQCHGMTFSISMVPSAGVRYVDFIEIHMFQM